jgi:hypothetical protein
VWNFAVRIVWTYVDSVEFDAVACEERSESSVHQIQGCLVEHAARESTLIGDDVEGDARVLERAQGRSDSRLEE